MDAQPSPGGDELRARRYLRRLGARPFGHQDPAMNDTPSPRPGARRLPDWWRTKPEQLATPEPPTSTDPDPDTGSAPTWWDDLYSDTDDTPQPVPEPVEDGTPQPSGWWTPHPGYYPQPHAPAFLTQAPDRIAISAKTRTALYNASAAGAGWALGLYDPCAWALADCGAYSTSGALVLGTSAALLVAHLWDRRTRHWWPGLAWAARIPLATIILALALWAPAAS